MNTTLLTAGVAAIIIAVVGGGASVFGATVPVIPTLRRQVALGLVGVAFLAGAIVFAPDNGGGGGGGTGKDVKAYRQLVVAACSDLGQGGGLPPVNDDGTTDRDRYIEWVRSNLATSEGILNTLWQRPVPDELKDEQANTRDDADNLVKAARAGVNQLEQALPTQFSLFQNPPPVIQQVGAKLSASSSQLNGSMSELAGQTCRTQQNATGQ
jgi:hypothetical protein